MEFQTRSDLGELKFFKTFTEAFDYSQECKDVWKISWDNQNRWVLKQRYDQWSYQSEKKLCQLSAKYASEPVDSQKFFWVQQYVIAPNYHEIQSRKDLAPSEKDSLAMLECITAVLEASEFRERFKDL